MLNLVCSLVIDIMKVIMNHNLMVVFMFSWVAVKYIYKVAKNLKLSILDNISLFTYILMIVSMK